MICPGIFSRLTSPGAPHTLSWPPATLLPASEPLPLLLHLLRMPTPCLVRLLLPYKRLIFSRLRSRDTTSIKCVCMAPRPLHSLSPLSNSTSGTYGIYLLIYLPSLYQTVSPLRIGTVSYLLLFTQGLLQGTFGTSPNLGLLLYKMHWIISTSYDCYEG